MTSDYVPPALRQRINAQARRRCGYCLSPEELLGMPMTVDHIVPLAAGGTNIEDNLWLACNRCNGFKGVQTRATDPLTGEPTALFNPRLQSWTDHFAWSDDSTAIIGRTPVGRATIDALKLNNPEIVVTRRLWVQVGWWPPQE